MRIKTKHNKNSYDNIYFVFVLQARQEGHYGPTSLTRIPLKHIKISANASNKIICFLNCTHGKIIMDVVSTEREEGQSLPRSKSGKQVVRSNQGMQIHTTVKKSVPQLHKLGSKSVDQGQIKVTLISGRSVWKYIFPSKYVCRSHVFFCKLVKDDPLGRANFE